MFNFQLYEGKKENKKIVSEEGVKTLISSYKYENYILYIDSFYTSPNLCRILYNNGVAVIGMTNAKRYRLDKICSNQLEKWESEYPVNNEIMYLAWKDKKQVKILSTVFSKDSIETTTYNKKTKRYDKINKPKLVVSY